MIRISEKITQSEFANVIDIKQATLSQIENGVIAPSLDVIRRIIGNFNISYDWLIDNTGTMLREPAHKEQPDVFVQFVAEIKAMQTELVQLQTDVEALKTSLKNQGPE